MSLEWQYMGREMTSSSVLCRSLAAFLATILAIVRMRNLV